MAFKFMQRSDFLSYTAIPTSEDSDYPATNLYLYNHPLRTWHSTIITAVGITADFGSTKTVAAVIIDRTNFTAGSLQGSDTDSWSPPAHYQTFTIAANDDSGRYGIVILPTGFSYRYAKIVIDAQTPTDGAAYFSIGRLIFVSAVTTLSQNPSYGFQWEMEEFVEENEFSSGGKEMIQLGSHSKKVGSFSWDALSSSYRSDIQTLAKMPRHRPIVLYENYLGDGSDYTIAWRTDTIPISWEGPEHVAAGAMQFEEVM